MSTTHPRPSGTDTHHPRADNARSRSRPIPNVIVFGETGAGKSSVLNMLEGSGMASSDRADVSDQAVGVTFSNTPYMKTIRGRTFRIFDTVGLNEGSTGTVKPRDAIEGLHSLIYKLQEGVSLLVYVMRAPRIKTTTKQNYEMFYEIFCQRKVPIVIVITGLEDRENMDGWWEENGRVFSSQGMCFTGSACITATKGKRRRNGEHCYEDEYNQSKVKVEKLVYDACQREPWGVPPKTWFDLVILKLLSLLVSIPGAQNISLDNELFRALRNYGGLSGREAIAEALRVEKSHRNRGKAIEA